MEGDGNRAVRCHCQWGIKRLTLTKEDAAVRRWFKEQTETLGCKVIVDEVGNMFAIRPGKRSGINPIAMGSHLDYGS